MDVPSLYFMKIDMIETPCTFRYRTYAVTFNNVSGCFLTTQYWRTDLTT